MSEHLPSLRYQVFADHTEGGDLGGGSAHTWVALDGGAAEERAYIAYDFVTAEGYTQRKDDFSTEGQAIRFGYDLSKSVYAQKRQFVLGAYAYVLSKSMEFEGVLPSGQVDCYLAGDNEACRKKFLRDLDTADLEPSDVPFDALTEGIYNPVSQQYLYPQMGLTGSSFYTDSSYKANAEVRFSGVKGAYPPYLDVVAEDVAVSVGDAHPVNTFADRTEDITLSWNMIYDRVRYATFDGIDSQVSIAGIVHGPLTQKSARVRWTVDGVTIHEVEVGQESSCVIPAGEITADAFQWQVEVCSSDGVWSKAEQWYNVRCDNDTLSSAVALQPKKIMVDGTADNLFQWEHHNESGSRPTGAQLQVSENGMEWKDLISFDGRDCYGIVPANSLPAGQIYWRVRTLNASGVAGAWSEGVQITVRSAPDVPRVVSVGRTPLPEITWLSEGQSAAEVSIDGKSKRIYGAETSMKWNELLEEGQHSVGVRVQNAYGLWSPWAEQNLQTINYPQANFVLKAEVQNNSVRLMWNRSYPWVQVFRDGVCVAEMHEEALNLADYGSVGHCVYQLRGISEEGYYTDSDQVEIQLDVEGAVVGKDGLWIPLKGRYEAIPSHSCSVEQRLHYRRFAAGALPLAYRSQQWDKVHQFRFSFHADEREELVKLQALSGESVIYKDGRGDLVCGVLGQVLSVHHGLYIDLSFTITEALEESEQA